MPKREVTAVLEPLPVARPPRPEPRPVAPSRPTMDSNLASLVAQQEQLARAAEELFAKLAAGDELSAGEWSLLRAAGPFPGGTEAHSRNAFNEWLAKHTGRLRTVRGFQQLAGSVADREQARQRAAETAATLATEAPRIEQQIAELQAKLATLAGDAKQAQAAVDRREHAVVSLQEERLLPGYKLDEIAQAVRRQKSEFRGELAGFRGRLRSIEAVLAIDPGNRDGANAVRLHVEGNLDLGGDTVSRLTRFFEIREGGAAQSRHEVAVRTVRLGPWRQYCDSLRSEAEPIKARIAELIPLEEAAAAELEKLRSHYVFE